MNALLLILSGLCFAIADALSKQMGTAFTAMQIVWVRYAIPFVLVALLTLRGGKSVWTTRLIGWQIIRGTAAFLSSVFFILSLQRMNMSDATALAFTAPVIIVLLAFTFYKEHVRWRAWLGIALSFVGAMIISPPSLNSNGLFMLLPIASAFCWAVAVIVTRKLSTADGHWVTFNWTFLTGLIISSLLMIKEPITVSQLDSTAWIMGFIYIGAQLCIIIGYSSDNTSKLAPLSYIQILWAALLSWWLFTEEPGLAFWMGAGCILLGSLMCQHRLPKTAAA